MTRLQWAFGILALVALVLFPLTGALASDKNAGTAGAQFLKIQQGARATALGGATVAIADGANSMGVNPAGLTGLFRAEFTAMHTQWFQDMNLDQGAAAYRKGLNAFGISATTLKVKDIQRRGDDESYQGTTDSMDASYAVSAARRVTDRISAGVTARYITQELAGVSANGWSADVGLQSAPESAFKWGFAIRHLGSGLKFRNDSDPLPTTYDLGVGWSALQERLLLMGHLQKPRDNGFQPGAGLEWNQPLGSAMKAAFRTGYSPVTKDAEASGLTLGAGLTIRRLSFDAAWVPMGDLGNTFRYAVRMLF